MEEVARNKIFGGWQLRFQHRSDALACDMLFSVYLPPQAEQGPVPVLYWLSGLTCNDQNFVTKAGAQRYAAQHGIAVVAPDTSPRGEGVPDDDAWDFAQGAGFYLNATQAPWSAHYHMYDYIAEELPTLIARTQPVDTGRCGIFGHSMGGHGAIVIGLRNPQRFRSISALAPIVAPMDCPWGQNAFSQYLGDDRDQWRQYDSCALIAESREKPPLLVDQGSADSFLEQQLMPDRLQQACSQAGHPLTLRMQPGYDHSYFFVASFIADHFQHHVDQWAA